MSDCINRGCGGKKNGVCMNDFPGVKCYGYEPPRKTNADRLRAMSDEELAEFLTEESEIAYGSERPLPKSEWLDWLRQEASDGEG